MKKPPIDREQLFGPVHPIVHDRLATTLHTLEEETPVKKLKYQPLLVALIILLLCGVAIATVANWDVSTLLTHRNADGEIAVNEELIQHIQPVGRTYEGDTLRVEVTDAIFDGRSIIAAWTVTNTTDETLYISAEQAAGSINWNSGAGSFGADRTFIQPGETLLGSMDRRVYDEPTGDTAHVGIRYEVLRLIAPTECLEVPKNGYWIDDKFVYYNDNYERLAAHEAALRALYAEGIFALERYGSGEPVLPIVFFEDYLNPVYEKLDALGAPYSEAQGLAETPFYEMVETLDVAFDLQVTPELVRSLLPDGEPIEKDYGEFTMRVVLAELSPNTLEIVVEAIYPDKATVDAILAQQGPYAPLSFLALDEKGSFDWRSNASWWCESQTPMEQEDGRWALQYCISHAELPRVPKTIEIVPRLITLGAPEAPGESPWNVRTPTEDETGVVLRALVTVA